MMLITCARDIAHPKRTSSVSIAEGGTLESGIELLCIKAEAFAVLASKTAVAHSR